MSTPETLPNGAAFAAWKDETDYLRTLHVAAGAAPGGDGSQARPFATIRAAAELAGPCDRVLIHEGLYRETVRPARGGEGPDRMLLFEGAPGESAVITGAEVYTGAYAPSEGWKRSQFLDRSNRFRDSSARVYALRLPRGAFDGVNPFAMVNGGLTPWFYRDFAKMFHTKSLEQQKVVVQKRGMLFADGARLSQVANYYELGAVPGSFYVEDDGLNLHLRLPDDGDPAGRLVEFTAREQCFCPEEKYLGYVCLKNLCFEKAGTGFPPPQRGAVSCNCGHHWRVEGCTVRQINGIGMDIGFQAPARMSDAPRGHMSVTGCAFLDCGFSGLVGTCGQTETIDYIELRQPSLYVADNLFLRCCWQYNEESMEEAALKLHHTRDSMVLRNRFAHTASGLAMWMDASHVNLAVRENAMLDTRSAYGAAFVECSRDAIDFSHNVIAGVERDGEKGGDGFRTLSSEEVVAFRNVILGCEGYGIRHAPTTGERYMDGRSCTDLGNAIVENLLADCGLAYLQPQERNEVEGNLYGAFRDMGYIKLGAPTYHLTLDGLQRRFGKDLSGRRLSIAYEYDAEAWTLTLRAEGGQAAVLNLREGLAGQIDALLEALRRLA